MNLLTSIVSTTSLPFNHIPGLLLWVKDLKSKYTACNEQTASLFGYKDKNDILGITDFDIRSPFCELAPKFQLHDKMVIESKQAQTFFELLNCNDSELRIFNVSKVPIMDHDNNVIGSFGHALDVSRIFRQIGQFISQQDSRSDFGQESYIIGNQYKSYQLTPRQAECLFFLLRGKTSKAIAKVLSLSPRTIETYIEQLKILFHSATKFELIDTALQLGFINLIPSSILKFQNPNHIDK